MEDGPASSGDAWPLNSAKPNRKERNEREKIMDRCNRACSISLGNIGFCKSKIYDSPIKQDFNEQQQQQQHGDVEYIGDEARHNLSVGCMCSSVKYILAVTI